ncbi:YTH domain-containing protein 1 [Mycena venus]|uniref:YTH domain-containing protein 1 n=1 Tax=Mycena venus TaxID=2733690 RepID=A0A8H6YVN3_9AGAR|nr:YTH domain-containing protein 1 [Mycena venus]
MSSTPPPSIYTGYPTLTTFPAHPYPVPFSLQQHPRPRQPPAMYPEYLPTVGPFSSPHFFPGYRWPAPPLPHRHYGAYGAQDPSVYQPAQYSYPAHPFHTPRNPPAASPIASTTIGERDSNNHRGKAKGKGKDINRAKPIDRQPNHPASPVSRSEWVMWVGNVPRDAQQDELWRFFTEDTSSVPHDHGILSIFLRTRSAWALVNCSSSAARSAAIARFDGVPLRTGYAGRALVCRAQHVDDHLPADTDRNSSASKTSSPASPGSEYSSTSTSSSMLARHFPQRFFILKSLTREDLDLSVRTGVWATQHHNEDILDRAFRTAADVVLIFSVNKSGEFYGWARMEGPVGQGNTASWAPRADQTAPAPTAETHTHTPHDNPTRAVQSAPALLPRRSSARLSAQLAPKPKQSLDPTVLRELNFPLAASPRTEKEMGPPADTQTRDGGERQEGEGEHWGQNFALRWMCTASLPFKLTHNLRNPWNHDRQVKIARDGTEIEPAVGHALIEQWSGSGAEGMLQGLKQGLKHVAE